jgi:hypothetical protein
MKKYLFLIAIQFLGVSVVFCQVTPNLVNANMLSPTTEKASKLAEENVNLFTGVPKIGVPLYSYKGGSNGLSLDISLDYYAGGIQVPEAPTNVGLGWYLNAGGIITRIARGMPDDGGEFDPQSAYLFSDTIPNDFRSYADSYYNNQTDAEQDIFQYNFNGRSGTFYIGKNNEVAQVPLSKMKILPEFSGETLLGFRIITEDGVKYEFYTPEFTSFSSYNNFILDDYNTSWSLSRIIAPFNTDTITLNYTQKSITTDFEYPQFVYVRNSDGVQTNKQTGVNGSTTSMINKISSIVFPDKTNISFIYGNTYYSGNDNTLLMVKVNDTSFKYGYALDYQGSTYPTSRILLKSVTPFTATQKSKGYSFTYYAPLYAPLGGLYDTIQNKRDYWGYYNGALNGSSYIPKINGYTWGADRNPNINYAISSTLQNFYLPEGGYINYEYELNDHLPFTKQSNLITFDPLTANMNIVKFTQVFNTRHEIIFTLDSSISRQGTPPISGTGIVTFYIKNTAGTITYATYNLSLYDLFYKGIQSFDFSVPNDYYQLQHLAASGTTISGSFPVKISWENKVADTTLLAVPSGGLRVKRITRKTGPLDSAASIEEYRYINTDGTSSGFLGDIPKYDYQYRETVNYNGVATTNYTAISSDPLFENQNGIAGYARVEVIKGTSTHNSGKTVYEFTSPQDLNTLYATAIFPYAPVDMKSWGFGFPKRIYTYDSSGVLVKKITNTYGFDTSLSYKNKNFRSLKLGNSYTYIDGNPAISSTVKTYTYIGREYYPSTGRVYLSNTTDTLYHSDGSKSASYSNYVYDTNFNVIKIISGYDKTRGLQIEKRFYYPYNYTVGDGVGKLRDSGIISPVVATESWITGDAKPRIISGTITYFHQIIGNYVKPVTIYSLQSNHPVDSSVIGAFNPASLNRNSTYFVAQENLSSYDSKGNLLQQQNAVSGISNSLIMDYGQRYPVAKVSNAAFSDIAYTSFEADGSGNWSVSSTARDTTAAITGNRSYNLSNGNITKSGLLSASTYLVSVWSKSGGSVAVNGVTQSNVIATQNGWNLYSTTVTGVTTVTVSGSGLIDELRLHPKDANMTTYTYQPFVGVTSTTDPNNTIVYNEYDALNRLKIIRDKDKNILKRFDYSDTATLMNLQPVWAFTKIYCTGGDGNADSTYTDTNIYSDTYGQQRHVYYTDYCTCSSPSGSHPEYKVVSGRCEAALKCITSSAYVKIINPDGTYYFTWKCTWHYQWSDGSVSPNYFDYHTSSCPLGCTATVIFEE